MPGRSGHTPPSKDTAFEQVEVTSDKKQRIVETGLYMKGGLFFAMEENKRKFEETGDERYVYSNTRLVIRTKLKGQKTDGFLMTVIPSVENIELTGFNPFDKVKYIERDKRFSGRIIYHDLNGEFVHGWVYEDGKITHGTKPVDQEEDPVVMMKSSGASDCMIIEEWGWTRTCTDWYQYDYNGNPVYVGTTCTDWEWGLINSYWECVPGSGGDDEYGDYDDEYGGGSGGGGQGGPGGGYTGNGVVTSSGICSEGTVANSNSIQGVLTSQHMDYPLQSVSVNLDILRGYATTKANECAFTVATYDGEYVVLNNDGQIITESGSSGQVTVSRLPSTHMWVHSHPQGQNPAPSPNDVVQLLYAAVDGSPNIRSNVIIASDGSEYVVHVNDPEKFMSYAMTHGTTLYGYNGADFRPDTDVAREYEKVRKELTRNSYTQNDAQAHALAYVLDFFDMGIKIYKRDSPSGDFKELKTVQYNNNKYQPQICE